MAESFNETRSVALPVLQGFAPRIVHVGHSAQHAPATKLALNMLMFASIERFAEAAAYLRKAGVEGGQVFGMLTEGPFATPLFKGIVASLQGDHAPDGSTSVASSLLDLRLMLEHAETVQASLPAAAAVAAKYSETARRGWGGLAQSAVVLPLLTG